MLLEESKLMCVGFAAHRQAAPPQLDPTCGHCRLHFSFYPPHLSWLLTVMKNNLLHNFKTNLTSFGQKCHCTQTPPRQTHYENHQLLFVIIKSFVNFQIGVRAFARSIVWHCDEITVECLQGGSFNRIIGLTVMRSQRQDRDLRQPTHGDTVF